MTMVYGTRVQDYFGGFLMGLMESHMGMCMLREQDIRIGLLGLEIWYC